MTSPFLVYRKCYAQAILKGKNEYIYRKRRLRNALKPALEMMKMIEKERRGEITQGEIEETLDRCPKKQEWFMGNAATWILYDSDDSGSPDDLGTRARPASSMWAGWGFRFAGTGQGA